MLLLNIPDNVRPEANIPPTEELINISINYSAAFLDLIADTDNPKSVKILRPKKKFDVKG